MTPKSFETGASYLMEKEPQPTSEEHASVVAQREVAIVQTMAEQVDKDIKKAEGKRGVKPLVYSKKCGQKVDPDKRAEHLVLVEKIQLPDGWFYKDYFQSEPLKQVQEAKPKPNLPQPAEEQPEEKESEEVVPEVPLEETAGEELSKDFFGEENE